MERGGAEGSPDPVRKSRGRLISRQLASPYSKRPPASGAAAPAIWETKDDVHFVREALKVNRDQRSEAQLGTIRKWLEEVKFKHLNMVDVRNVIPQLAQAMEFVEHPAFQPLFEQGDAGDYLYLVLHGEIAMHIKTGAATRQFRSAIQTSIAVNRLRRTSRENLGGGGMAGLFRAAATVALAEELPDISSAEGKPLTPKSGLRNSSRPQTSEQPSGETVKPPLTLTEQWGKSVFVCKSGDSFGELALMSKDDKRSATAVSAVSVQLARIHSSVYDALLKRRAEVLAPLGPDWPAEHCTPSSARRHPTRASPPGISPGKGGDALRATIIHKHGPPRATKALLLLHDHHVSARSYIHRNPPPHPALGDPHRYLARNDRVTGCRRTPPY